MINRRLSRKHRQNIGGQMSSYCTQREDETSRETGSWTDSVITANRGPESIKLIK